MTEMSINQQIASLRKNMGITQEELAGHIGVTNQSVSKWESAVCCPDIQLLPVIADFFSVSIDELFGRAITAENKGIPIDSVPWDDDDKIRAVVYLGKKIIEKTDTISEFTFIYRGEAKNVDSQLSIQCDAIQGNANAGCDISCKDISGSAEAGCDINCKDIRGSAEAGCDINCENIFENATAGCDVNCTTINGQASAGCDVNYHN